jgi:hypothetical protein
MSETKIDFVPQTYPLYVPVMPRNLPWLPPSEGEGIWSATLAELTDEAWLRRYPGCCESIPLLRGG